MSLSRATAYFNLEAEIKIDKLLILSYTGRMKRRNTGHYITVSTVGERVRAFVPAPLPPEPGPELTPGLLRRYTEAMQALAALETLGNRVEEAAPFMYICVRREAVLSSRIEGTQSSLNDLCNTSRGHSFRWRRRMSPR